MESKSYNILQCVECKKRRANIRRGSFLCETCFDKLAARLREKYGRGKAAFMKQEYGKWKQIAKQNGICYETFRQRVKKGLSLEEAATKPIRRGKYNARFNAFREKLKKYGLTAEYIEIYQLLVVDELSDEQALEKLREKYDTVRA